MAGTLLACARPAAVPLTGGGPPQLGVGGGGRARLAPALGSGNAAASGAGGSHTTGEQRRRSGAAVPPQWHGSSYTRPPEMLRDGNFGRRPDSPVLQTPRAEPPLWHGIAASRQPTGGRTGIGLCRATPAAAPPLWSGSALDAARAAAVATRARAHQQERVETRRPSACCLRPRLKHRPAPAKAGSLLSGVVAANREDRRAATRAAAVASSVCACPTITRRARLGACSSLWRGSQSAFCLSF